MDALFAILAGGRGTRLGGGKLSAELGGRPLLMRPLEAAAGAVSTGAASPAGDASSEPVAAGAVPPGSEGRLMVVAKPDTELPPEVDLMGVRILREPVEPSHPLTGIVAALREADGRAVVVVAADMPFVTAELLGSLAARDEPLVVPEHGGRLHPLLALYAGSLLGPLEAALRDEAALQETVRSLGPRTLTEDGLRRFGDPERLLFNVNTPEDLARAEAMLAA